MRIFVTGSEGQLARSIKQQAAQDLTLLFGARPQFDLTRPEEAIEAVRAVTPDLVVNAAAYTAVDKAESEPERVQAINAQGATAMAKAAAQCGVPIIHLSTDYVFDGTKASPYLEDDATGPLGVYGASKLQGEQGVAAENPQHVILRTSWVYSPFDNNFVKTMLRLGAQRPSLSIVADQHGNPTSALALADVVLAVARQLDAGRGSFGIFHAAGQGDTTWHDFAREIFRIQADLGFKTPEVAAISTADYPTPAKRPANSRLDCTKLSRLYGLQLPSWQDSLLTCMLQLHDDAMQTADPNWRLQ